MPCRPRYTIRTPFSCTLTGSTDPRRHIQATDAPSSSSSVAAAHEEKEEDGGRFFAPDVALPVPKQSDMVKRVQAKTSSSSSSSHGLETRVAWLANAGIDTLHMLALGVEDVLLYAPNAVTR